MRFSRLRCSARSTTTIDFCGAAAASAEGERERNDFLLCSEEVFRDGDRSKKIQQQNHDLKAMIDLLYGKWEALSKEKEELEVAPV